jgi:radical SAM superfamily enzyme YgiQ (UPF0313 family)
LIPLTRTIGLVYLSELRVALSSLAFHLLREMIEYYGYSTHRITIERDGIKNWDSKTFETRKYNALFISVPYELMYKDLVSFLYKVNIPYFSKAREQDDPLIILGGPSVTGNPLPVSNIADAIIIGEAENIMEEVLDVLASDYTRKEKARRLSEIPGVFTFEEDMSTHRIFTENLNNSFYPTGQLRYSDDKIDPIWGKALLVEVSRGCTRGCLFCMEGRIFRPYRFRSGEVIDKIISKGFSDDVYDKITLYSLSFFDHPESDSILNNIIRKGLKASVPSLRVDTLNEKRISMVKAIGQKTLTLAPETGSSRLAKSLRKEIYSSQVEEVVDTAIEIGIKQFKFYLMTGFYGETKKDIEDTIKLLKSTADRIKKVGGKLKVSVNPFIPKPFTPLQWHGFGDVRRIRDNIKAMRKSVGRSASSFTYIDPKYARLQTILSRGGPELSKPLALWGQMEGFLSSWRTIAINSSVNEKQYLSFWDPDYTPLWHLYITDNFNKPEVLRQLYLAFLDFQNESSGDS